MLDLPKNPDLRAPLDPNDAARRTRIIERAIRARDEIRQYFRDVAAWNAYSAARQLGCEPIDPDPDGELAEVLAYYDALIAKAVD